MTHHSIAIPLALSILMALALWRLADAKGDWWLKIAMIVLLTGTGVEVWKALDSYAGWPTGDRMPSQAILISAVVREPNPRTHDPGAIYVWTRPLTAPSKDLFDERPDGNEPRAYRLPYSREMHEQLMQAMQAMAQGRMIGIGRPSDRPGGNGPQQIDGDDLQLYELPPPDPPRKDSD